MLRCLVTLLLGFALSSPLRAHAQGSDAHLDQNAQAVAIGERGLEAFRRGDWDAAYRLFHEAERSVHSPVFLLYMARARERQQAVAEAMDLYTRVSNESLTDAAPEPWKHAVAQALAEREALRSRAGEPPSAAALPKGDAAGTVRTATSPEEASPRPKPKNPGRTPAAIAAGAVGTVGIVLGATAGLFALFKFRDVRERCNGRQCDARDLGKLDTVNQWARVADLGFVVAGTGLVTAAGVLWIVPAESTAAPARRSTRLVISGQVRF